MNCCLHIGSCVPVLKPVKQRAYLRRKYAHRQRSRQAAFATQSQLAIAPYAAVGGRVIAALCMLAGGFLLYLAAKDYVYYAPVRHCAISFLEGISRREVDSRGLPDPSQIEIRIHDIKLDQNRATVRAALAVPGNWINTELYASKNKRGSWEIVGVTRIDAHVENRQNLELAKEIKTAFRSIPGVQIKRY